MKSEKEPALSNPSSPNKIKGVAAATGLAVALGAGVVGAALVGDALKPKETKVEVISQADKPAPETTTTSTEAPTTTIAIEQKDIQTTPNTVAIPETTTSTATPNQSPTTTIHTVYDEDGGILMMGPNPNSPPMENESPSETLPPRS